MKGKKFDIQFTFNRLTVQMEHRACERIAPEQRKEMRQVLFPQQESLVHRAEINKQVGGGYVLEQFSIECRKSGIALVLLYCAL